MKNTNYLLILLTLTLFVHSCASKKETTQKAPNAIGDNFVYIPEGIAIINDDTIAVSPFWISRYELSNTDYLAFLNDLKDKGLDAAYKLALPDTVQWINHTEYGKPLAENYLRHPAYKNHPVVNISHKAATLFCEWLTEKHNSNSEAGTRYVFRLPTHSEWLRAAQAGENRPYSWNTPYLRDTEGRFRANFKHIPNELLSFDQQTQQISIAPNSRKHGFFQTDENGIPGTKITIATPVDAYWAGTSGLYNMNGNVAEMIDTKGIAVGGSWNCLGNDVQNTSVMKYNGPSPFVGFRVVMAKESN
ncbi:MAG: hypothetical protein EA361_15385 [Bacteroidetes bacterium]|nr:MAG: hypothetical protein EA361_15385 [Bacteroidota bacterium]